MSGNDNINDGDDEMLERQSSTDSEAELELARALNEDLDDPTDVDQTVNPSTPSATSLSRNKLMEAKLLDEEFSKKAENIEISAEIDNEYGLDDEEDKEILALFRSKNPLDNESTSNEIKKMDGVLSDIKKWKSQKMMEIDAYLPKETYVATPDLSEIQSIVKTLDNEDNAQSSALRRITMMESKIDSLESLLSKNKSRRKQNTMVQLPGLSPTKSSRLPTSEEVERDLEESTMKYIEQKSQQEVFESDLAMQRKIIAESAELEDGARDLESQLRDFSLEIDALLKSELDKPLDGEEEDGDEDNDDEL